MKACDVPDPRSGGLQKAAAVAVGLSLGVVAVVFASAVTQGRSPSGVSPRGGAPVAGAMAEDAFASCGDAGLILEARKLAARSSGVRLDVAGPVGSVLYIRWPSQMSVTSAAIVALDGGVTRVDLPIPPGEFQVGCFAAPFDANDVRSGDLSMAVVEDDAGHWRPASLSCAAPTEFSTEPPRDTGSVIVGAELDTIAVARDEIEGLRSSDDVRVVFYPDDPKQAVKIAREGVTVALAWRRSEDGLGRLMLHVRTCDPSLTAVPTE